MQLILALWRSLISPVMAHPGPYYPIKKGAFFVSRIQTDFAATPIQTHLALAHGHRLLDVQCRCCSASPGARLSWSLCRFLGSESCVISSLDLDNLHLIWIIKSLQLEQQQCELNSMDSWRTLIISSKMCSNSTGRFAVLCWST